MATRPGRNMRVAMCVLLAFILAVNGTLLVAGLVWPEASGDNVKKKGGTTLDMSHVKDGYVMVRYKRGRGGGAKKLKARLSRGEETYTYDLRGDGEYEVFPLQMGNGNYALRVYEQVSGSKYAQASAQEFKVDGMDERAPFLCPSQYVWYDEDSVVVQKSRELCEGLATDEQKVQAVYRFMSEQFAYDFVGALTLKNAAGYLPDIDQVYQKGMGVCFDIAAIMACMLRVQGIPTRLVIGYAGDSYHAWNDVMVNGNYVRYDATAGLAGMSISEYTAERIY